MSFFDQFLSNLMLQPYNPDLVGFQAPRGRSPSAHLPMPQPRPQGAPFPQAGPALSQVFTDPMSGLPMRGPNWQTAPENTGNPYGAAPQQKPYIPNMAAQPPGNPFAWQGPPAPAGLPGVNPPAAPQNQITPEDLGNPYARTPGATPASAPAQVPIPLPRPNPLMAQAAAQPQPAPQPLAPNPSTNPYGFVDSPGYMGYGSTYGNMPTSLFQALLRNRGQ
jgi:hypothetical protein